MAVHIICQYDVKQFENEINEHFERGYTFLDGIRIINTSVTNYTPLYYVTMIKYTQTDSIS